MEEDWKQVLQEAIKRALARKKQVPGAVFKKTVQELIQELDHPPLPDGKFSEFLKGFEDVVTMVPRPGGDCLVVPSGPIFIGTDPVNIRQDFYKAFTLIDKSYSYFYNPANDEVIKMVENSPADTGCVAIPRRTEDSEVAIRQAFIEGVQVPSKKERLAAALSNSNPIPKFSDEVRALSLMQNWFDFRKRVAVSEMTKWAVDNHLLWREEWVTLGAESQVGISHEVSKVQLLTKALSRLEESDLSRITVPLDVVLKLLKNS